MNRFVILLLVSLAMAVGYLLGTEDGREKRDHLIAMLKERRGGEAGGDVEIDLADTAETETEAEVASQPA